MDASTPVGRIITALKEELKSKGFHYRDVAARLKVSEATVKRYLNGKGVTLAAVQKLAEVVDLDLLSLAASAKDRSARTHELNKAQEEALGRNRLLRGVNFLLAGGWTPARIAQEFDLHREIDAVLAKLQALGLIRVLPNGGIKILVRPKVDYKDTGIMAEDIADRAREFLSEIRLGDKNTEWIYSAVRLSEPSAGRLRDLIKRFESDLRTLSMSEAALPPSQTQWYRVFNGAEVVERKRLMGLKGDSQKKSARGR